MASSILCGKYSYGFNGKENIDEVYGKGKLSDFGDRLVDPRLGKFLSVDPLQRKFPFYSVYHFAGNSPIANIDLDGLEPQLAIYKWNSSPGFYNHRLYWKERKCAHCDEWVLNTVVDADGSLYYVARRQVTIYGKEEFAWYYPKDPDAHWWFGWTPNGYEDPKETFKYLSKPLGQFADVLEKSFLVTFGTLSGYEAGVLATSIWGASYEFIKQYGLGGANMEKIDWANVAIKGAPLPKGLGKIGGEIVRDLFEAGVDHKNGKFIFAGSKDKPIVEAGIEAVSSAISSLVIGKYQEQLKAAFKDTDPAYMKQIVEQFVKFGNEYMKEILSNGMVDKYKEVTKSDKKD